MISTWLSKESALPGVLIDFYLCFSSSARIDFSLWQEKKKFQRKCVYLRLDKFAWTSAVLNSRREIDRLVDANNSIMETDGEGKFVSFKVVLGSTPLFILNQSRRSRLPRDRMSLLLAHWSSWGTHHEGFRDESPRSKSDKNLSKNSPFSRNLPHAAHGQSSLAFAFLVHVCINTLIASWSRTFANT